MDTTEDIANMHPINAARKGDVQAATELCRYILSDLKADKPLGALSKQYLIEAMEMLLDGTPMDEAFLLKRGKGRPRLSDDVKFDLYDRIEELKAEKIPADEAYRIVAEQKWLDGSTRGADRVEQVHKKCQPLFRPLEEQEAELQKVEYRRQQSEG